MIYVNTPINNMYEVRTA